MKRVFAIIVVALFLLTTLGSTIMTVAAPTQAAPGPFSNSSSNNVSVGGSTSVPAVTAQTSAMKYIAFRDDDIELGSPSAASTLATLDQVHVDEGVPVTLAIVPHPDRSSTANELTWNTLCNSHLNSIKGNTLFEFAQHGYDHYNYASGSSAALTPSAGASVPSAGSASAPFYGEAESQNSEKHVGTTKDGGAAQAVGAAENIYSEFYGRPYADQYNAIKQGRDDIRAAFGVTPTTFVPPFNKGDVNTLKATAALGFTLYHTSYYDFNVHEASLQGIMVQDGLGGFPYSDSANWPTAVSDLTQKTDSALNSASGGQHFVIEYHYWGFAKPDGSANTTRVGLFKQYIEHLKSRGDVTFVTLAGQNLKQPTQLSLSASTVSPSAGQTIALSGTLQTKSTMPARITNAPVYLHVSRDNVNWVLVSNTPAVTDSNGAYRFSGSLDQGTYYLRTYFPGSSTIREAFSPTVKVTVSPATTRQLTQLSLSVSNATPDVGKSITFSGVLKTDKLTAPGVTNAPVYLHVSRDNVNWVLVSNTPAMTNSAGAYSFARSFDQGTYYLRTYYPGASNYREAFSPTVKVTAKNSTTLSLAVSSTTPTVGQSVTFTGVLTSGTTALVNQPVHLERRTGTTGTWGDVAGTYRYTNSSGIIKLSQTMATAGTYQYRWHYNGTATYKVVYSSAVTEVVKNPTTLTISSSPTAPAYNQSFTLSGTLKSGSTGLVGYSVHLEKRIGSGSWADVADTTRTTTTDGVIPHLWTKMTTHNTYSYRWHFTGTGTYKAGYSPAKTFTV